MSSGRHDTYVPTAKRNRPITPRGSSPVSGTQGFVRDTVSLNHCGIEATKIPHMHVFTLARLKDNINRELFAVGVLSVDFYRPN